MGAPAQKKQFALDANLLFDLAADQDFAHTLREVFQEKGYLLHVPPTVLQEVTYAARYKSREEKLLGMKCLQNIRNWGLQPFDLPPVGHGVTEQFSKMLAQKGLLPDSEFNDGLILAETSLVGIPVLVTSDGHLLGIDPQTLAGCFVESDISVVQVVHPKLWLAAMVRMYR